jgi:hypothetical protein
MCRRLEQLCAADCRPSNEEIETAALQSGWKVSNFRQPLRANSPATDQAAGVTATTHILFARLQKSPLNLRLSTAVALKTAVFNQSIV